MKIEKNALRFALSILPVGIVCSVYLAVTNYHAAQAMGSTISLAVLIVTSLIQVAGIYTLILAYLGYQLATKAGLLKPFSFNRYDMIKALLLSVFSGAIMLSDYYVFAPLIPQVKAAYVPEAFNLPALLFSMLYGGVLEEIMLRFFFLSLIVVIMDLVFKRTKTEQPIPAFYYFIANFIAAVFFALGHLPATRVAFGSLSGILVLRSLILNGVLGYLFGWVYIKMGLQYAMITHGLTHLVFQGVLYLFIL